MAYAINAPSMRTSLPFVVTMIFTMPDLAAGRLGRTIDARLVVVAARSEMVPTFVAPT